MIDHDLAGVTTRNPCSVGFGSRFDLLTPAMADKRQPRDDVSHVLFREIKRNENGRQLSTATGRSDISNSINSPISKR